MGIQKVHLEDSLNQESLNLPINLRRDLIRYLTHVPITPEMDTTSYMLYQVKALQNLGFKPEDMVEENKDFWLFCDVLRKHYDFVTKGQYYN